MYPEVEHGIVAAQHVFIEEVELQVPPQRPPADQVKRLVRFLHVNNLHDTEQQTRGVIECDFTRPRAELADCAKRGNGENGRGTESVRLGIAWELRVLYTKLVFSRKSMPSPPWYPIVRTHRLPRLLQEA